MKLYTGYFNKLSSYEGNGLFPIAVCGKSPNWYTGKEFKKLAPKFWFFDKYKKGEFSEEDYVREYQKEVLDVINPKTTVIELYRKSNGRDIILLCWESPEKFCHRHLIADWFRKELDIDIKEFD